VLVGRHLPRRQTVFSSHIWTILSKPAPLTFETGERAVCVAAAAEIDGWVGSTVDSAGLEAYVVDAARATREQLRASPRAAKNFMLGMM
jgi:hypothetical protein